MTLLHFVIAYVVLCYSVAACFFFGRSFVLWRQGLPTYRYRVTGTMGHLALLPVIFAGQQLGWVRANFAAALLGALALGGTATLFAIWDAHLRR